MILVLDEELRPAACGLAAQLRAAGRTVDIQLEPRKKMKAAIKVGTHTAVVFLVCVCVRLSGCVGDKKLVGGDGFAHHSNFCTHTQTRAKNAQAAERAGAGRLLIVGGDEWARGAVAVRDLAAFEQSEVAVADLVAAAGGGSAKRPRVE